MEGGEFFELVQARRAGLRLQPMLLGGNHTPLINREVAALNGSPIDSRAGYAADQGCATAPKVIISRAAAERRAVVLRISVASLGEA